MKNGNKPAYGWSASMASGVEVTSQGLTKRELFAAMAMQGLLSSGGPWPGDPLFVAQHSVRIADALLAELERAP